MAETMGTRTRTEAACHTPKRNFRCPDEVWQAAAARAAQVGESMSEVLRRALEDYAEQP